MMCAGRRSCSYASVAEVWVLEVQHIGAIPLVQIISHADLNVHIITLSVQEHTNTNNTSTVKDNNK